MLALLDSGKLELFVLGHLSNQEAAEISNLVSDSAALQDEVAAIELALISVSAGFAPTLPPAYYQTLAARLIKKKRKKRLQTFLQGFLASIGVISLLLIPIFYAQFIGLQKEIAHTTQQQVKFKDSLHILQKESNKTNSWLTKLRAKENQVIRLTGTYNSQPITTHIYFNPINQSLILDFAELPQLFEGEVYMVWGFSATNQPTAIGVINTLNKTSEQLVELSCFPAQAYGITIETATQQTQPNMSRLLAYGQTSL